MPAIVEATTLPTITAAAKGSEWTGYVNAYVLDSRREQMVDGNYRQGLWYLSYVLPKGQGAVGQAIANTFFSNAGKKQIFLEGYGYITLGSHRQDLVKLGYKVHWNYCMETLGPNAIQCIIEPLMLTTFDPNASGEGSHHQKKGKGGKQKGEASLSTAPSTQSFEDEEGDMTRREQKPMFLLLVPGHKKDDEAYRQTLHWTYLRKRCPFDLCEEWAPSLWERAVREGEVKELEAWSYVYQAKAKDEDFTIPSAASPSSISPKDVPLEPVEESPFQAVLSRAYLCLPNIEGIHASLVKHVNVTQDTSEKVEVAA